MRRFLVIGAVSGILLAAVAFTVMILQDSPDEDAEHYRRGETLLVVSNPGVISVSLFKADTDLGRAIRVDGFDGSSIWLPSGNYFVRASHPGMDLYYPVPLRGYRQGPDEGGTFLVTLRPQPSEIPPRILDILSPFKFIPSGTFLLGDRQNPREPHYCWLTSFFIAPYEVTNEEFLQFLNASDGYLDDRNWTTEGIRWKAESHSQTTASYRPAHKNYARFGQPDQPVTWVTWYEANAYCRWLSRRFAADKWMFTLPTDAEWEKAARGPDSFDYALGTTFSDAQIALFNWKKNPWDSIAVIGTSGTPSRYNANRYGLYHMTGNVVEWTQSINTAYNREHPYADDERNHDDASGQRSARGGSWYSAAISYLYIPYRDAFQPEHCSQDIGFRVVCRKLP